MFSVGEKDYDFRRLWSEAKAKRFTNVLIIDDDVDAAVLVATVFRQLDCNVTLACELEEARRRLVSNKADIIILDWILGKETRADQVLQQSIRTTAKFTGNQAHLLRPKPKVISFSTLPRAEVHVPSSPFFEHLDHWQKPMQHRDLIRSTLRLLAGLGA